MRIFVPCTHTPLGKTMYLDDPELGLIPVGASADSRLLKNGGENAYFRSKHIDSKTGLANTLEIHCCPPLYHQKHNLFGHSNLPSYAYTVADLITYRFGIPVSAEDRTDWEQGNIKVTEVHLTANFACPSDLIQQIIAATDENNAAGKSKPFESSITLGLTRTRRSLYHMLTLYDKYQELLTKFPKKPGLYQTKLLEAARNMIRAEVKLYSQGLKYEGLGYVRNWCNVDVADIFFKHFDKYKIDYSIQRLLTEDELALLSSAEFTAYTLWLKGMDLAKHYSRTTVWKHAHSIKDKVNIDIAGSRRPESLPGIELKSIFSRENVVPVPEWLLNSEYYWGPNVTPFSPASISRVRVITDEQLLRDWNKPAAANNARIEEGDVPY